MKHPVEPEMPDRGKDTKRASSTTNTGNLDEVVEVTISFLNLNLILLSLTLRFCSLGNWSLCRTRESRNRMHKAQHLGFRRTGGVVMC